MTFVGATLRSLSTYFASSFAYRFLRGHPSLQYLEILKARVSRLFFPSCLSVGWLLCGDKSVGSSRIHGINLHKYLRSHGVCSFIVNQPKRYSEFLDANRWDVESIVNCNFNIVIFQRVHGAGAAGLISALQARGVLTIFFVADIYESEIIKSADYIFAVSNTLRDALVIDGIPESRIFVIPDAIETGATLYKRYIKNSRKEVRLVWVGAEGHWSTLSEVRRILREDKRLKNFRLVTISNHPEADIRWALESVWSDIMKCDIGVVPADTRLLKSVVKSNNRVTMFKALGMPVVCSRLPAYEDVVDNGITGFIADNASDWVAGLLELSTADRREAIGMAGRELVFEKYGIDRVGERFQRLLRLIARKGRFPDQTS